ncbi:trypsin-like serine peptidase [Kocuria rosea]|uniref:trypsin-like serine peptidase n=1 Tax=Kocuria rosea TaxID=1275 RepID=UPI00254023DD|nr:hypothetical protein [Kocuria rosea]WIG15945.1 hypothetical protein QOY29_09480 [Kocuria rosea]
MHLTSTTRISAALAAVSFAFAGTAVTVPVLADTDTGPREMSASIATTAVPAPTSLDGGGNIETARGESDEVHGDPRVMAYWTPERLTSAVPVPMPPSDAPEAEHRSAQPGSPAVSEPATIVSEPVSVAGESTTPVIGEPGTNQSSTNGKIFFRNQSDGRDYVCSGSALSSGSKRLVVTAGHCVHGGPGRTWHANWVFIPGYSRGDAPHGTFQAAAFRVFDDWMSYGTSNLGFNSDVAFVTTYDNASNQTVVDAVGGYGLQTGGGLVFDVTVLGYPGNLEGGQRVVACSGTTEILTVDAYLFSSIRSCDFGGGSSGGPWLYQYNQSSDRGYVRSVTSFGPSDSNEFISGPYFSDRVQSLYHAANGDGTSL